MAASVSVLSAKMTRRYGAEKATILLINEDGGEMYSADFLNEDSSMPDAETTLKSEIESYESLESAFLWS